MGMRRARSANGRYPPRLWENSEGSGAPPNFEAYRLAERKNRENSPLRGYTESLAGSSHSLRPLAGLLTSLASGCLREGCRATKQTRPSRRDFAPIVYECERT